MIFYCVAADWPGKEREAQGSERRNRRRQLGGEGGYMHTQITCKCHRRVCATNVLGIHLRSILLEGRAAMVQRWVSTGGCGVVRGAVEWLVP